ncbi:hypothetical protein D9M71_669120 [compost metagenome]
MSTECSGLSWSGEGATFSIGLVTIVSVNAAWDTDVTLRQKRANNQRMKRYP